MTVDAHIDVSHKLALVYHGFFPSKLQCGISATRIHSHSYSKSWCSFLWVLMLVFRTSILASSRSSSCPQVPRSQRPDLVPLRTEEGTQDWEKKMYASLLTNFSEEMKHQISPPRRRYFKKKKIKVEGSFYSAHSYIFCFLEAFSRPGCNSSHSTQGLFWSRICGLNCKISCWTVSWHVLEHQSTVSC